MLEGIFQGLNINFEFLFPKGLKRKSCIGFQMTWKSMTLYDIEKDALKYASRAVLQLKGKS